MSTASKIVEYVLVPMTITLCIYAAVYAGAWWLGFPKLW